MTDSMPISFLMQVQGDQEVKSKIGALSGAFQNFGSQAEQVNEKAERLAPNFQAAALGISAAATSAVGLAFQFDNLGKSELREQIQNPTPINTAKMAEGYAKFMGNNTNVTVLLDGDEIAKKLNRRGVSGLLGLT